MRVSRRAWPRLPLAAMAGGTLYVAEHVDERALRLRSTGGALTILTSSRARVACDDEVALTDRTSHRAVRWVQRPPHRQPRDVRAVRTHAPYAALVLVERDVRVSTLELLAPTAHFWGMHGGDYAVRDTRGIVAALNQPRNATARARFARFTYVARDGSRTHADTWGGFLRTWRADCERHGC